MSGVEWRHALPKFGSNISTIQHACHFILDLWSHWTHRTLFGDAYSLIMFHGYEIYDFKIIAILSLR